MKIAAGYLAEGEKSMGIEVNINPALDFQGKGIEFDDGRLVDRHGGSQ